MAALVCAAGNGHEVTINLDEPATSTAAPAHAGATSPARPAPARKDARPAAKKSDPNTKTTAPGHVEGFSIGRSGGGFLGVKVVNNTFQVHFYDKNRKPTPVDVSSIALRWPVPYQPNPERTLLTPRGDGTTMSSPKAVRPPFRFKLFVTLLKADASGQDQVVEDYVVDFAQ